jgi:hypothetical protein
MNKNATTGGLISFLTHKENSRIVLRIQIKFLSPSPITSPDFATSRWKLAGISGSSGADDLLVPMNYPLTSAEKGVYVNYTPRPTGVSRSSPTGRTDADVASEIVLMGGAD